MKPCARDDVAVFSPVASSAALLAVAWATSSVAAGCGGVAAVVAAFLVDHRHHRIISPVPDDERAEQYLSGRFG